MEVQNGSGNLIGTERTGEVRVRSGGRCADERAEAWCARNAVGAACRTTWRY